MDVAVALCFVGSLMSRMTSKYVNANPITNWKLDIDSRSSLFLINHIKKVLIKCHYNLTLVNGLRKLYIIFPDVDALLIDSQKEKQH